MRPALRLWRIRAIAAAAATAAAAAIPRELRNCDGAAAITRDLNSVRSSSSTNREKLKKNSLLSLPLYRLSHFPKLRISKYSIGFIL